MRKILAIIAVIACAHNANAGSIKIVNTTLTPVYLVTAAFSHTPAAGVYVSTYTGGTGSLLIHPSVSSYFYATPGNLLTSLTGTTYTIPASAAFLTYAVFRIGATGCPIGISYPNPPTVVTCDGTDYRLTLTATPGIGDVVVTISY